MGLLVADRPDLPLSPLAHRALQVDDQAAGLVRFLAALRLPAGPVLVDGQGATDWVVVRAGQDPHLAAGALSIPRPAQRHLERIAASGACFDVLLIGHELTPGTIAALDDKRRAALTSPKAGATPASLRAELAKLVGDPPPDRVAAKVLGTASRVVAAVAAGSGALAAGAGSLIADGLDPFVFGGVSASGAAHPGELTALFYLTHWT